MITEPLTPYLHTLGNLLIAVVLGTVIGYERQRRQRLAGLQTNALVALGAAAFVMTGIMTTDETSPTRIAAQVVSGIGFLCAGVIMRDGLNIRGLNTAATLWCSAAVGVMVGAGFALHAVLVSALILFSHFALRPLSNWINARLDNQAPEIRIIHYKLRLTCHKDHETRIRKQLVELTENKPLAVQSLSSTSAEGNVSVAAKLISDSDNSDLLEQVVDQLRSGGGIIEVKWTLDKKGGSSTLANRFMVGRQTQGD